MDNNLSVYDQLFSHNPYRMPETIRNPTTGGRTNIKKELQTFKNNKFTGVTIKLNTAPFKEGGYTSAHNYRQIINYLLELIKKQVGSVSIEDIVFEMDSRCQLHCHLTIMTKKVIFRKKILQELKTIDAQTKFDKIGIFLRRYYVHMDPLSTLDSLQYWTIYLNKARHKKSDLHQRELYHYVIHHYHNPSKSFDDMDLFQLADHDVEIRDGKPYYYPADKVSIQSIDLF